MVAKPDAFESAELRLGRAEEQPFICAKGQRGNQQDGSLEQPQSKPQSLAGFGDMLPWLDKGPPHSVENAEKLNPAGALLCIGFALRTKGGGDAQTRKEGPAMFKGCLCIGGNEVWRKLTRSEHPRNGLVGRGGKGMHNQDRRVQTLRIAIFTVSFGTFVRFKRCRQELPTYLGPLLVKEFKNI